MKVGDFAGAELIDDFLNGLEFFGEDFCLEGAGRERLDGGGDDLVFIADESLHFVQIQNDLSQVLGVLLNVLVVLVPEGVEALVDAVHHCPLLLGHQLDHLLVDLGRHLVVGSNRFLEGDDEGVEVDESLPRPEHARLLGLDRVEGTDLLDEVDVFGLKVDRYLVLVLLDQLEELLLVELVVLQDHVGLLVPLLHDGLSVELLEQGLDLVLALAPLGVLRPVLHQDLLYLLVVFLQLVLDLLGPHDGPRLVGQVSHLAQLDVLGLIVGLQEFLVEEVDALLDCLQQLTLVFLNR